MALDLHSYPCSHLVSVYFGGGRRLIGALRYVLFTGIVIAYNRVRCTEPPLNRVPSTSLLQPSLWDTV